jgi:hypothetical protein
VGGHCVEAVWDAASKSLTFLAHFGLAPSRAALAQSLLQRKSPARGELVHSDLSTCGLFSWGGTVLALHIVTLQPARFACSLHCCQFSVAAA